jgi:hypothetical protein
LGRRPKGVAGVIAAVILFATIFVVGISFFLFVSNQFQAANQAYVKRAGVQLQASQEELAVTAGLTRSSDPNCQSCVWVRANNTGGQTVSVLDVYVTCLANCTGSYQQGQMMSGFLRQPPRVNATLPITLGIGASTAFLPQCPPGGSAPHRCTADLTISKTAFQYAKGEYVVISLLTSKGNVFSTQYPLPPISSQNYLTVKSVSTHIALSLIGGGPELSVLLKTTALCPSGQGGCTQTFNCNNGCITVNATVYNLANSTANGVSFSLHTPYSDYVSGTASVSAFSPCAPLSQNIAAGKSVGFTCKFDASTGTTGGLASFSGAVTGTLYGSSVTSAEGLSNAIEIGGLAAVTTQGAGVPNFFLLKYSSCYQNSHSSYAPPCTENVSPLSISTLPSGSYVAAGSNFYVAYYVQVTNAFNTTVPLTQYSYLFGEPSNTGEAFFFLSGTNTTMTNGVYYPDYVPGNLTTHFPALTPYPADCSVVNAKNVPLDPKCIYINPGQTVTLTFAACGYGASNWAWAGQQDADGFDNSAGCTANPPNLCITQGACVPEGLALGIVLGYYYHGYLSQLMPFEGAALVRSSATYLSCSPSVVVIGTPTTCTATVVDTDNPNLKVSSPMGAVSFSGATLGEGTFSALQCALSQGGNPVGTSSCQITYTPTGPKGNYSMIASYAGDYYHDGSTGHTYIQFGTTTTTTITTTITSTVTTTISTTSTVSSTTTLTTTIPVSSTTTTSATTTTTTSRSTLSSATTSATTITSYKTSTSTSTTTTTSSTTTTSVTTIPKTSSTSTSVTTSKTTITNYVTSPASTITTTIGTSTATVTVTNTVTSTSIKASTTTSISSSTTTITTTSTTTITTTSTSIKASTTTSISSSTTTLTSTSRGTSTTTSSTTSSSTTTSTTTVPLSSSTTTSATTVSSTSTTTSATTTTKASTWTTTIFEEGLYTVTFSTTTTVSSTTTITTTLPVSSSTTTISGTSYTTSTTTVRTTSTIISTIPVSTTTTITTTSAGTSSTTVSSTSSSLSTYPLTTSKTTITTTSATTSSTTISSTTTSVTTYTTKITNTNTIYTVTTISTTTPTTVTQRTTSTTTITSITSSTSFTTSTSIIASTTTITQTAAKLGVDYHGTDGGSCSSSPCTLKISANPNDVVVVMVLTNSCSNICTLSISGGVPTWNTRLAEGSIGSRSGAEYWGVATSALSGASVTITYGSGFSSVDALYISISGANTNSPYDPNAAEPAIVNAVQPASCTMSTTNPNDILFGFVGQGGTPLWYQPTGWTAGDTVGAFEKFDAWDIVSSTILSQLETWNTNGSPASNISGVCDAIQAATLGTTTTTTTTTTSTTTITSPTTSTTTITVSSTTTISSTSFTTSASTVFTTSTSQSTTTSTVTSTTTETTTSTSTAT